MQSLFGFDLPTAQKWVIAFGVILILLVLLGLFARQIKDGRLRIKGQGGGRTRQPRLGVVDIHDLDRQRQLVLIRRDNVEHLVMIGGASDVVIETNILRSGVRTAMPAQADLGVPDRPLPFDTLVPQEPTRQDLARQDLGRQDLARHEPAEDARRAPPPAPVALAPSGVEPPQPPTRPVQPASRPVQTLTQAEAAVAAAAGGIAALGVAAASKSQAAPVSPASLAPTSLSPAPVVQAPHFTRDHAPAASAGELDDMARQLDEALKRPFSAVRPANAPVPPADAVPAPAEPLAVAAPVAIAAPVAAPAPAVTRALPMDVEAELEMALGLKPERTGPKPAAFSAPVSPAPAYAAPKPFESAPTAEPVAAAAPEPVAVESLLEPDIKPESETVFEPETKSEQEIRFEQDIRSEPETEPQMGEDESEAIFAAKQPDETATSRAPEDSVSEVSAKDSATESAPEPEPKPIDPFSVDAIEAEFARLLGRDSKTRP